MKIDEAKDLVYYRSYGTDGPTSLADLATALSITLREANLRIAKLEDKENKTNEIFRMRQIPKDEFTQLAPLPRKKSAIELLHPDEHDAPLYEDCKCSRFGRPRPTTPPLPNPCIYPEYQDANTKTPSERKFDGMPKTSRQWQEYYEACFWVASHGGTMYGTSGFGNVVKAAYDMGWVGVLSKVTQ